MADLFLGAERIPYDSTAEVRKKLFDRLTKLFINCPRTPMPHGTYFGYLWGMFPQDLMIEEEEFWKILNKHRDWVVVPEDPTEPCMVLHLSECTPRKLPFGSEWFLFPADDQSSDVLAIDHEGFGPWYLDPDRPRTKLAPTELAMPVVRKLKSPGVLRGRTVDHSEFIKTKRRIRSRLREKVYIPAYRLATSGPAADNLWNYLPDVFDASIEPGSLARELFASAESVFAWTEAGKEAYLIDPREGHLIGEVPDAYYLEWPRQRWLLAVPEELLVEGPDESFVQASLVVW